MKKNTYPLNILALLIFEFTDYSHAAESDDPLDALKDKLSLSQSSTTPAAQNQPASSSFTIPDHGANFYAIDAALGYKQYYSALLNLSANAEIHRDDVVTAKTNSFLLSVVDTGAYNIDEAIIKKDANGNFIDESTKAVAIYPTLNLSYKNDRILNTESALASFSITPFDKDLGLHSPYLYNGKSFDDKSFDSIPYFGIDWIPSLGLEGEDILHATKGAIRGRVFRGTGGLSLFVFPALAEFKSRLEFSINDIFSYDVARTGAYSGAKYHQLITTALSYYFDTKRKAAIALSYNDGSNPITGTSDEKYLMLSMTIKL